MRPKALHECDSILPHEKWDDFTDTDHKTWNILCERQHTLLPNRTVKEVIDGMEIFGFNEIGIPKLSTINPKLQKITGFTLVPVTGLVSERAFFELVANRQFPVGQFIRKPHELDYIEEPDIFHDLFGHAPLLTNPIFADCMELFGKKALQSKDENKIFAARFYWFTFEFGLIKTQQGLRIYGAGITSSPKETIYSLESDIPIRIKFNIHRLGGTQYHLDAVQKTYFVIEDFQQLFDTLQQIDFDNVHDTCQLFPEIEQGIMLNSQENCV